MKNLVSILIFVFAVTFATQAQKRKGQKGPKMTTEQQATLKVKKMTLALDLDTKQQREVATLIKLQIENKKVAIEKKKALRKSDERPTSDEIFAMKNNYLEGQIAMKNKMKSILDKEQFEKFEKMVNAKKRRLVKKIKGKKRRRKNN